MGSITTYDFLSNDSKRKHIDDSDGLLRERLALGDITSVFDNADPDYLPEAHSTAIDKPLGKKQHLMHPVHRIEHKVSALKSNGKPTSWKPEEDDALRNAVQIHNARNWKLIAKSVPNRTDVQCLHRWQKVLNPILVKGYWTQEEDDRMNELVRMFGTKRWAAIARCLPGRNGKQCRERWCNHLDPRISRDAWTEAEDMLLFLAHTSYGNKWAEISKLLPGRSDNGIKNRWNTSVKKKAKDLEQYTKFLHLESAVTPTPTNPETTEPEVMCPGRSEPTEIHPGLPDLLQGEDIKAAQSDQEEHGSETYHGFTSYCKAVTYESSPNSRSAVENRQIAESSTR